MPYVVSWCKEDGVCTFHHLPLTNYNQNCCSKHMTQLLKKKKKPLKRWRKGKLTGDSRDNSLVSFLGGLFVLTPIYFGLGVRAVCNQKMAMSPSQSKITHKNQALRKAYTLQQMMRRVALQDGTLQVTVTLLQANATKELIPFSLSTRYCRGYKTKPC